MYKLLFRKMGTVGWSEGPMFSDDKLTPEAWEILAERYTRYGLEARLVRVREERGDQG